MNPPYGTRGGDDIHFKFTEKCIQCCNKEVICVMPFALINGTGAENKMWRNKLEDYTVSAEELSANNFFIGTNQPNIGIYLFKQNKNNENINITYIDNRTINTKTLNISVFNEYEKNIIKYLMPAMKENDDIMWAGYIDHPDRHFRRLENKFNLKNIELKTVIQLLRKEQVDRLPDNKIYLVVNACNGSINAKYCNNNTTGRILKNKQEVLKYLIDMNTSAGYNFIFFDTIEEAENCKKSLLNPLLRFILSKLQTGRSMKIKICYKYIPDIDWSDSRVTTDEGLLEVCGCPKDKAKEYAEYCRKYMEEFDNKNNKK